MGRKCAHVVFLLVLMTLLLSQWGCGGSGSQVAMARVRIPVEWEPDARAVVMPAAAKSALFTLTHESGLGPVETWHGSRSVPAGGNTIEPEEFESPNAVPEGKYFLSVQFFNGYGTTGSVIATAFAPVRVLRDGTVTMSNGSPLERVSFASRITELAVLLPEQRVFVSSGVQPSVIAYAGESLLGAIRTESVQWSIVSGASHVRLHEFGFVAGLSEGPFQVKATYQGVDSPAVGGFVDPPIVNAGVRRHNVADAIFDPSRGEIWVAVNPVGDTPSRLDLVTNDDYAATTDSIPLNGTPSALALSDDEAYAFVGFTEEAKVARVQLATKVVEEFSLADQARPGRELTWIAPRPGAPKDAVVYFGGWLTLLTEGGLRANKIASNGAAFAWSGYRHLLAYSSERDAIDSIQADGQGLTSDRGSVGDSNSLPGGLGFVAGFGVADGSDLISLASGRRTGVLERVQGDAPRKRHSCLFPSLRKVVSIDNDFNGPFGGDYAFVRVNSLEGGTYFGGVTISLSTDTQYMRRVRPLGVNGVILISDTNQLHFVRNLPGM